MIPGTLLPLNDAPTWSGSVPRTWNIRRLKYAAPLVNTRTDAEDLPYIGLEHVESWTGRLTSRPGEASPQGTTAVFQAGDVLFGKLRPYLAKVYAPDFNGRCSPELLVLRPVAVKSEFLRYFLLTDEFIRRVDATTYGAKMPRANWADIGAMLVPVPPIEEQRAIADHLDEKTAALDALIAKRERHIKLLEEKRQTVLVDRVTRGLAPTVPFRETGVTWLGGVPAHWRVAPTRFVARLETGHTPSRQHPEYWAPEECTVPWFTLADVWQIREGRKEYLGDTAEKVSLLGLANSAARLLPAETIVLSRTASVGFSGIMPVPMATSQDFVNWVCGPEIRPLYLLYVFRAMRQEFRRLTMGSTHQTIYMPDVRDFRTPLPPLEEQDAIVAAVRAELARHDGLVARLRTQIEKLREYRQSLISAAVTGQLPVREEVPA